MKQKKNWNLCLSNEQILFLSIIAVLLVVILLLGITITRNQLSFKPANTRMERDNVQYTKKINEIYNNIVNHYIEEVDAKDLFNITVDAMVSFLNDPYSGYIIKEDALHLQDTITGNYSGIGANFIEKWTSDDNYELIVSAVTLNGPADKAGLKVGDRLIQVDGVNVADRTLNDAIFLFRGVSENSVNLLVQRNNQELNILIKRQNVLIETIQCGYVGSGIFYMKIIEFTSQTAQELSRVLKKLESLEVQSLIIDLRNNPGGELESVIRATDLFLNEGLIIETKSRSNIQNNFFRASVSASVSEDIKIAIIINENTASGAEVMAAALQDLNRASIYGRRSFGKSSVQIALPLSKHPVEYFKLTVAYYYTASGRNISKEGVVPDYEISPLFKLTQEQVLSYKQLEDDITYQEFLKTNTQLSSNVLMEHVNILAESWLLPVDFLFWQLRRFNVRDELFDLDSDYTLTYVVDTLRDTN